MARNGRVWERRIATQHAAGPQFNELARGGLRENGIRSS